MSAVWRIYYGDGSTLDNTQSAPEDVPGVDCQVIVQADPDVGWAMFHTRDYYIWTPAGWLGVDTFGLWDYLTRPGWKKIIAGRTLTRQEYQAIYRRAKAARDFAKKNGFLSHEMPEELE